MVDTQPPPNFQAPHPANIVLKKLFILFNASLIGITTEKAKGFKTI